MTPSDIVSAASVDQGFSRQLHDDPLGTMKSLAGMPLQHDVWIYRLVVLSLSLVALLSLVGALVMAYGGRTTPESVVALGATAIGAIAGLLAPTPRGK